MKGEGWQGGGGGEAIGKDYSKSSSKRDSNFHAKLGKGLVLCIKDERDKRARIVFVAIFPLRGGQIAICHIICSPPKHSRKGSVGIMRVLL